MLYLENTLINKFEMESIKQNFLSKNLNLKHFEKFDENLHNPEYFNLMVTINLCIYNIM